MDLNLSDDERSFQLEVKEFLATRLPRELSEAQRTLTTAFVSPPITQAWLRILNEKGWATPLWPREYGGPGWTTIQRYIFEGECAAVDAPVLFPQGVRHVGPLLIKYGSAEQKARFLPRILSGEDYWCQGYSEPGAGSDLANITTRASLEGNEYVINGTKIWTTDAHCANWMFALVRTSVLTRKQEGLSILIVPMDSPGITVRPIRSISGHRELNQVFLDDVRVPIENLIGEQDKGWDCARYVLDFERGGSFVAARLRRLLQNTVAHAQLDSATDSRVAILCIEIDTLEMMELRLIVGGSNSQSRGDGPSILKLRSSLIRQEIARFGVELAGPWALRWDEEQDEANSGATAAANGVDWSTVARHLSYRAYTIFAGASEIQREIIARNLVREAR